MTDDLEHRAGKGPEDAHPDNRGDETDPSDYADPRVAQPGDDPAEERARRPAGEPPRD